MGNTINDILIIMRMYNVKNVLMFKTLEHFFNNS